GEVGDNDEYSEVIPDDFFVENDIINFYCEGYDSTDGTYSYGTDQNGAGPFTAENPGVYYIGSPTSIDVTVTFQVNMSLVSPVYDVSVAGTFNGWTPGAIILTDPDEDDIYVGDYTIPEGSNPMQEYKFINGTDWEYISNRTFIIDDSSPTQILPVVYFNDQNPEDYISQDVTVTFNVDISDSASAGCIFDSLGIYGSVAPLDWDWETINNHLAEITPDILWSGEVLFPTGSWKYVDFKLGRNGMDLEAGFGENHSFTIDDSNPTQIISCVYGTMGPVSAVDDGIGYSDEMVINNYPNPFSTFTTISFSATDLHRLPQIKIYNVKGQLVKCLECGESLSTIAPTYREYFISWDGRDDTGKSLSNGIYFFKLQAGSDILVNKMILLR
nr:T9SS type A sorting domain-containing protein [Candidatus Cloacimonadota bacterium]